MSLRDSLTSDEAEVLSEVLNDALEQARETLRLHEDDSFDGDIGDAAETYVEMIATQSKRLAIIEQLLRMMG